MSKNGKLNLDQTMPEKTITIDEVPRGQRRPKYAKSGNFVAVFDPDKEQNLWIKHLVQMAWYGNDIITGAIKVKMIFYMPIPKTTSKKKHKLMLDNEIKHTKKPDVDNIIKKYCDAMTSIIIRDDRQIWYVEAVKLYSDEPRTVITLQWEGKTDDEVPKNPFAVQA